jgi:hypothetical protein
MVRTHIRRRMLQRGTQVATDPSHGGTQPARKGAEPSCAPQQMPQSLPTHARTPQLQHDWRCAPLSVKAVQAPQLPQPSNFAPKSNSTYARQTHHVPHHAIQLRVGQDPIHKAAHRRRRSAASHGWPAPTLCTLSCPSISARTDDSLAKVRTCC